MGVDVTTDDIFLCVSLFGLIVYSTTDLLPFAISNYAEGISSVQRIQVNLSPLELVNLEHMHQFMLVGLSV